jgi:hypothetical protein
MTGGHGAVPYFTSFMVPFMKGKPMERFPEAPPMPSEIKSLMERNKREELEKLENATVAGVRSGAVTNTNVVADPGTAGTSPGATTTTSGGTDTGTKPADDPPPVVKPILPKPQTKDPDPPKDNGPEGTKRKGKKGDG